MHQKCQTGWIHDLAGYFLSKDQFVPGFPDLLTFARLIQKLICILIISMNRVVKYEHFEGYFVEEFIITTPFLVEICIHIYWGRQGIFAKNLNSFFSKLW